ncbi:hypothetical protein [Streptomyces mangrovi]|uniref:hypothetical protein n=1 Tax=Streptomyces mangrovi TaxID=1206892 RepID=UPI00399D2F06
MGEGTRIALTVAAAWALEEARSDLGEPFLRVLHHMIMLWRNAPRSPNEVTRVTLSSGELQQAFPDMRARIIRLIPDYFSCEPFLSASYNKQQDGSWTMDVPRGVTRYEYATDLLAYVRETCRQVHLLRQEADMEPFVEPPAPTPPLDAVLHISASRTALLKWLWHQKQQRASGGPMPNVLGVLSDDEFAMDQGVRFTEDEIDRASAHLEQHGLIKGGGTIDEKAGPVLAEITAPGEDCVENYNGDVSAYIRQRNGGTVTFHIATNMGNIAANSTGFTQNAVTQASSAPAQILAAVSLIRQLAPALTPDAGEQQALLTQVSDLQAAASAATPDHEAVRRIANGIHSTLHDLAYSPDVQRLALEAVEQGIQNL